MALSTLFSLLMIWVLFFWLWRDYRLDLCRDRLFTIRQELFDLALSEELSFDSPAYGILRSTINGTIQYAHRFSLFEFVGFAIASRGKSGTIVGEEYREKWDRACESISSETKEKLETIRSKVHFEMVEQMIMTSAILMFSLISIVFVVAVIALQRKVQSVVKQLLSGESIGKITERFDSTVFVMSPSGTLPEQSLPRSQVF